jgi:hypothetical protein
MELAEHVVRLGRKMVTDMFPPKYVSRPQVDADLGANNAEVVQIQSFVLDHKLAMGSDQGIVDRMNVMKVVINRHDNIGPMLGLRIKNDRRPGMDGTVV